MQAIKIPSDLVGHKPCLHNPSRFPFLEYYQESPSQKISFFGNHFLIWKSHDSHRFPKKEFLFWENVSPDQKKFHQKIAFFGKSHDLLTSSINPTTLSNQLSNLISPSNLPSKSSILGNPINLKLHDLLI